MNKFTEYDDEIRKRDLRRFFTQLRKEAHSIYAILYQAPKSFFRIVLRNDDLDEDEAAYTLSEFYANLRKFRTNDTFRIEIKAYFFREEWDECVPLWQAADYPFTGLEEYEITRLEELDKAEMEKEWPHMLAYFCRERILANSPFWLCRRLIRVFGLTRADVKQLKEPLDRCNERVVAELRAKYDQLARIDCLHMGRRVPRPDSMPEREETKAEEYERRVAEICEQVGLIHERVLRNKQISAQNAECARENKQITS